MFAWWKRYVAWRKRPKNFIVDTIESIIVILPLVILIKTFVFGLYQVPTCSMETTMLVGERFYAEKFFIRFSPPKHGDVVSFNPPPGVQKYSDDYYMELFQRYFDWRITSWTKRVLGVPGDHMVGTLEDGVPVVYRNGIKLDEPYVNQNPIVAAYIQELEGVAGQSPLCRRSYSAEFSVTDPQQPFYRLSGLEVARGKAYYGATAILQPHTASYDQSGKCVDEYDVVLGEDEFWMIGDNRLGSWDSRFFGPVQRKMIHGKILFRIWSIDSNEAWWILDLIKHPIDFWKRVRWGRFFQKIR
jgi:signal peptidase I